MSRDESRTPVGRTAVRNSVKVTTQGARRTVSVGRTTYRKGDSRIERSAASFGPASESDLAANQTRYSIQKSMRSPEVVSNKLHLGKDGSVSHHDPKSKARGKKDIIAGPNGKLSYLPGKQRGGIVRGATIAKSGRKKNDLTPVINPLSRRRKGIIAGKAATKTADNVERLRKLTKRIRRGVRLLDPFEHLIRRMTTISIIALIIILLIPISAFVLSTVAAALSMNSGPTLPTAELTQDSAIVASYLFDNRDELWPQDEDDILRIAAVLGAISSQTSTNPAKAKIDPTFYTTDATKVPLDKQGGFASGWQGMCAWTNEEIDEFIAEEREAGRYAGYAEGSRVADLYTQCKYLKKELEEIKDKNVWKNVGDYEAASSICYSHLIQDSKIQTKVDDTNEMAMAVLYTLAFQERLKEYDARALNIASFDYDTPEGRLHVCYPTQDSYDYAYRKDYVVKVTLPKVTIMEYKDENGETVREQYQNTMEMQCHWLIASRLYECFYEAAEAGYLISDASWCFVDLPDHPGADSTLGLTLIINENENTPDEDGEYHESIWGSVIDEDLGKIFTDHGFIWDYQENEQFPRYRFRFV